MKKLRPKKSRQHLLLPIIFLTLFGTIVMYLIALRLSCPPLYPTKTQSLKNRTPVPQQIVSQIPNYQRSEEVTYLTFPEWYIVFSTQEYAQLLQSKPPSEFAYFSSTLQYWCGYTHVVNLTKEYPFNLENHIMLTIIGTSFSIENAAKGLYEKTIGKLSEQFSGNTRTEEEIYAAQVASEYGTFLPHTPWYKFPFKEKLFGLWNETNLVGPHVVRKAERKIVLSLEYGIKMMYGWLLTQLVGTVGTPADTEIMAHTNTTPGPLATEDMSIHIISNIDSNNEIISLPRYDKFRDAVIFLAQKNVHFYEVGGNDEILMSIITPKNWDFEMENIDVLFDQTILIQPTFKRMVINVSIPTLTSYINYLTTQPVTIEHIYDY